MRLRILLLLASLLSSSSSATTYPGDVAVLDDLRKSLSNPEILKWPAKGDDPCGDKWPHVYCDGSGRVTQIQAQNAGLEGSLPASFSRLDALTNLGLQNNQLTGPIPTFRNFASLQYAFLNGNNFTSIPADFFVGLTSLLDLSLDGNPLNESTGGWMVPDKLSESAQLVNLTLTNCGLVGEIPTFLGSMQSLKMLTMSYNNLSGPIPASFAGSTLQVLWLNNQNGAAKLSGSLDIVATLTALEDAWLHGNEFSGPIPDAIGACTQLWRIWLNNNRLVGMVPENLTSLPDLKSLKVDNNMLVGPIPAVKYNFTYAGNSFCSASPGVACSPVVMSLLSFLAGVGYPSQLAQSWSGDDPCLSYDWQGVSCAGGKVTIINLPNWGLNGTISPALGNLSALTEIRLAGNNLTGRIPDSLTGLASLTLLNVSSNDLVGPVPPFRSNVKVDTDKNPHFNGSAPSPSPGGHGGNKPAPGGGSSPHASGGSTNKKSSTPVLVVGISVGVGVVVLSLAAVFFFCRKKRKGAIMAPAPIVIHPRDSSDPDNVVKIVMAANNAANGGSSSSGVVHSGSSACASDVHMIEAGNLVISVQVLRDATKNFAQENVLGRGGFGVVYKGELHDGTMIAVKRMEASVISNKALDEFHAEIAVLTKVRHRNLVSILGYSIEGNERLLVYEFMCQGALSKHLFHWKQLNLEPLSWKKRLNIALDVARGMEYLHTLAHQCFIHRDLKSANILLADDFRAKVADFGLVKLAPDGKYSVATRLAGTFGYLAPEYAVTGKITTKADVFSFGVVLMELVTGLTALDESRPEETRYLASWFCQIKNNKENLRAAIDPSLDLKDETFESICVIAELAGHCAAREPHQRPDMGHAVTVLVPMVEKWKPVNDETEEYMGIDLQQPLLQMVKGWQAAEGSTGDGSILSLDDSKGSIPARPAGFAESFTSADGR